MALQGQFEFCALVNAWTTPLTATVVALETRREGRPVEQAVMISCDLTLIPAKFQQDLRGRLRQQLPGFDDRKVFVTATHTHTAPVLDGRWYAIPKEGVMQPEDYTQFALERLSAAAVEAWNRRQAGGVSWALGNAVVGHNRRAVYADSTATMYGALDRPDFQNLESGEDPAVGMLFFWDQQKRPVAVAINVRPVPRRRWKAGAPLMPIIGTMFVSNCGSSIRSFAFSAGPGACGVPVPASDVSEGSGGTNVANSADSRLPSTIAEDRPRSRGCFRSRPAGTFARTSRWSITSRTSFRRSD